MNKNKIAISSLASDLKRVAICLHRGSNVAAERFAQEAKRRALEINVSETEEYIKKIISRIDKSVSDSDMALMHSTLLQNYSTRL